MEFKRKLVTILKKHLKIVKYFSRAILILQNNSVQFIKNILKTMTDKIFATKRMI